MFVRRQIFGFRHDDDTRNFEKEPMFLLSCDWEEESHFRSTGIPAHYMRSTMITIPNGSKIQAPGCEHQGGMVYRASDLPRGPTEGARRASSAAFANHGCRHVLRFRSGLLLGVSSLLGRVKLHSGLAEGFEGKGGGGDWSLFTFWAGKVALGTGRGF